LTAPYDVHVKTRRLPVISNLCGELYGIPQNWSLRGLQYHILFHHETAVFSEKCCETWVPNGR
jgi:hypothetical protein